jgi:hypothetical protein
VDGRRPPAVRLDRLDLSPPIRASLRVGEITFSPRSQDTANEASVGFSRRQQMVGPIDRYETLRMPRCAEDPAGMVDPYHLVCRRMKDEEGTIQRRNSLPHMIFSQIVEKLTTDTNPPTRKLYLRLPHLLELGRLSEQQMPQMIGVARGTNRRHRPSVGDPMCCSQHRGSSQTVTDKEIGRTDLSAEVIRGRDQIGQIGGEVGLGKGPLALPEAREIKAQNRKSLLDEGTGDTNHGLPIFRAGETVSEKSAPAKLGNRYLQPTSQLGVKGAREADSASSGGQ